MERKILTSQAMPGMVTTKDIYSNNNQKIIAANTTLTDKIITRLKFYSINQITILIPEFSSSNYQFVTRQEQTKKETHSDHIKRSEEFKKFNQTFIQSVDGLKDSLNDVVNAASGIQSDLLLSEIDVILSQSRNGSHVFDMLHCMRDFDDLTYSHSLSVALICNIFGEWLNIPESEKKILTLCGLLHDIGKLKIPYNIITKPAKLTEDEYSTIKTHTIRGYHILADKDIDTRIKNAALMHHEKCDGSGYPNGLTKSQIDDFAKIVAIADIYDAMTSARVYRGRLCPFEVIELFESEGFQKYDANYILTFLNGIIQTYLHNQVRLNDGKEGEIIMINKQSLSRPIVKVGEYFINLEKERNLSIIELL